MLWCSSGHTSFRLFQKAVNCFECKINGQALDAALGQSHGCSDLQAPHAVSKSVQQLWSCTVHTARVSLCEKVQQLLCYELSLKFKKVLALAPMQPTQVCWELCLQMRGCWHYACAALQPRALCLDASTSVGAIDFCFDEFSINNDKNINQIYFHMSLFSNFNQDSTVVEKATSILS